MGVHLEKRAAFAAGIRDWKFIAYRISLLLKLFSLRSTFT